MNDLIIIGGGGHAKVVLSLVRKMGDFRVLGYTDRNDRGLVLGAQYLGSDTDLGEIQARLSSDRLCAVLGVGQVGVGRTRSQIWSEVRARSLPFPSIVSPNAIVNEGVPIGEATVVMDGAIVTCGAKIGIGVILNTGCVVDHDTVVGDWVHVAPGATISGGSSVGEHSMIGVGATVIEGVNICENCMVGAGAVVIESLTRPGTYVGAPARWIK